MSDRAELHELELEAAVYTFDGWVHVRRWLEERLEAISEQLLTHRISTTTFEEVAEQKGQIRELRAILERPEKVDTQIRQLREQLQAAQGTE